MNFSFEGSLISPIFEYSNANATSYGNVLTYLNSKVNVMKVSCLVILLIVKLIVCITKARV
jgi:hypothetical protein